MQQAPSIDNNLHAAGKLGLSKPDSFRRLANRPHRGDVGKFAHFAVRHVYKPVSGKYFSPAFLSPANGQASFAFGDRLNDVINIPGWERRRPFKDLFRGGRSNKANLSISQVDDRIA